MEFAEYVARQRPALMRFATVLTCRTWLADDLVSDVLGRAFERWDRISAMAEPNAYVRRMVVNEYLSWRRKWSRYVPRAEIFPAEDTADHADRTADRDQLISELAKLPRRQRAVLVLRYYGGLSDAEIAETLGCSAGTVRAHASRALATLRIELATPTLTSEVNHAY